MWKHLLLLKCEKAVVEAAGLQCMAQICLVTAAVVILPSNFCGPCTNVCWAHPHVPHTPGHLANSKSLAQWLVFLSAPMLCLPGMHELQPLAHC